MTLHLILILSLSGLLPGSGCGAGPKSNAHRVDLSWKASNSPNVAGYVVYRSTSLTEGFKKITATRITGTQYTDTTVEAGKKYYYRVSAVDSKGVEGAPTANITVTVPSGK
jgi:fibronectin type 3 domain-containing protein